MSDTLPATPRTGDGTKTELALATAIARAIALTFGESLADFFVAGHEHEGLSKGSVSVAWEGGEYNWTIDWPDSAEAKAIAQRRKIWFEPINGCILAVHKLDG